jgi:hypothetical protein
MAVEELVNSLDRVVEADIVEAYYRTIVEELVGIEVAWCCIVDIVHLALEWCLYSHPFDGSLAFESRIPMVLAYSLEEWRLIV